MRSQTCSIHITAIKATLSSTRALNQMSEVYKNVQDHEHGCTLSN
jgi:hypothetical protein